MSIDVIKWVLTESTEKPTPRLVLVSLAYHAKKDGTDAFPSVATIMAETGLSHGTVCDALKGLEARGAIERTGKRRHGTVIYTVTMRGVRDLDTKPSGEVSETWTPEVSDKWTAALIEVSRKRTRGVRELDSDSPRAGHEPSLKGQLTPHHHEPPGASHGGVVIELSTGRAA